MEFQLLHYNQTEATAQRGTMNELKHAIEMADIAYSMDYTDDARLTLLERKVDAIIEYLLNKEETNTKLTKELYV